MNILKVWPEPTVSNKVEHLPEGVKTTFEKARWQYNGQHYEEACLMFRKTLDIATKDLLQDEAGTLYARIKRLASDGKIPADLADFAHTLRELGNEFTHASEPTSREAADVETATRLFLMYTYTLPTMLKNRRAESLSPQEA